MSRDENIKHRNIRAKNILFSLKMHLKFYAEISVSKISLLLFYNFRILNFMRFITCLPIYLFVSLRVVQVAHQTREVVDVRI